MMDTPDATAAEATIARADPNPKEPTMSPDVTECHTRANDLAPASHEEAPAPDEKLSDRQLLAIDLILAGRPDAQVAQAIGVSRRTIIRWRLSDADVIAELRRRRRQRWQGTADRLRALLDPALDVLAEQLNDRVDRARFRAATTILRLANVKSAVPVEAEEEGE